MNAFYLYKPDVPVLDNDGATIKDLRGIITLNLTDLKISLNRSFLTGLEQSFGVIFPDYIALEQALSGQGLNGLVRVVKRFRLCAFCCQGRVSFY
jgi:hypothetical protein